MGYLESISIYRIVVSSKRNLTDVTRFQTLKESGAGSIVLIVFESI